MKRLVIAQVVAYIAVLLSYTPVALANTEHDSQHLCLGVGLVIGVVIASLAGWYLNFSYRSQYQEKSVLLKLEKIATKNAEQAIMTLAQEQEDSQDQLEERVQERTLELNIALQELESANQELERKNVLDELTGLHNRRFYDQKIIAEYRRSRRNLTALSLVLIDIDHFKLVNDTHGHLAGDQCLIWVAKHIKNTLKRSTDKAFRYGGEEFCLILPNTDAEGAFIFAEQLRLLISEQPADFQNTAIQMTISCGICTYQQEADLGPEQIFAGADKALYQAKNNGRNQTIQHTFTD